jgi:hypothetical protein
VSPEEALAAVRRAFENVPRPELMIRGTCSCCECAEHNQTLLSHTPETITLQELGNAAWDPICFASDAAFAYYLRGMIRLALEDASYTDQLLFHLNCPGRVEALDPGQARAVLDALWVVTERAGEDAGRFYDDRMMEDAMGKLEVKIL